MHIYAFESYGVRIRVESNRKRVIERVRRIANVSLLGRLEEIEPNQADHVFIILKTSDSLNLVFNGEDLGNNLFSRGFYTYFESRLRVTVAEYAKNMVFLHAGVVGWKGKAIVFPADSFQGKTTLVAALVRLGAVYYSDDYAIIDENGLVHPFARRLSMRDPVRAEIRSNKSAAALGGVAGEYPLPIGAVILTRFRKNGKWKPKTLTAGNGLLEIIPQTIPVRENTKFALGVLKKVSSRAIIAKSSRGDAKLCVKEILRFVDKLVF